MNRDETSSGSFPLLFTDNPTQQLSQQQISLNFSNSGDSDSTNNAAQNNGQVLPTKPALDFMGSEQIKNLERVLQLNNSTIQTYYHDSARAAASPTNSSSSSSSSFSSSSSLSSPSTSSSSSSSSPSQQLPIDLNNTQYNPYLYNAFATGNSPTFGQPTFGMPGQSDKPLSSTQQQDQQQHAPQEHHATGVPPDYQPCVQFPFMPFWTACPLPFNPVSYPQIILPPSQPSVGPHILRPIPMQTLTPTNYSSKPAQPRPIAPRPPPLPSNANSTNESSTVTPSTQTGGSQTNTSNNNAGGRSPLREEKNDRFRDKRAKRNWGRCPDPKLSKMASGRPRDQTGKFISSAAVVQHQNLQLQELAAELFQMKKQLLNTEMELDELRKRQNLSDDMYFRSVNTNAPTAQQQPFQAHQQTLAQSGVIYSPFRGGNTAVEAFKQKIDLQTKREALKKTHSPFLEDKVSQVDSQLQWQDLGQSLGGGFIPDDQGWPLPEDVQAMIQDDKQAQTEWVEQFLMHSQDGGSSGSDTDNYSDDEDMRLN